MSDTAAIAVKPRTRWIRSSQTTNPGQGVAAVESIDAPRCSSPRPLSSIDRFRARKLVPPLPTPTSPTLLQQKKRPRPTL